MGCDIHAFAEVRSKKTGKWSDDDFRPFDDRNYSLFAFLANVRNYDCCEPIAQPRGIPDDVSDYVNEEHQTWLFDGHSASHLTLRELLEFDYDKTFWNRRVDKQIGPNHWTGAGLAEEGEGQVISYRENLGENFFADLKHLATLGEPDDVRIVFWFDN